MSDEELKIQDAIVNGLIEHYKAVIEQYKAEIEQLKSVAIPTEHDGCKDCKYETYPEYYYPCCSCKQNYKDMWEKKPHWKPYLEEGLTVQCSECGSRYEHGWNFCPNCGAEMVEPQESEGKE